jgi:nicotinamide-nucleotide amidase
MKIQLLLTGNELMAGHIVDSNSAMIAEKLAERGYSIYRKVTIGDDFELLIAEILNQSKQSEILIINGGLGPTVDDLTAQALARAAGQDLLEHPQALEHLQQWCEQKRLSLNEANRKQALLPAGADIIANPIGSAVGISLTLNDCLVICTPGVPSELRAMLDDSIVDSISTYHPLDAAPHTLRWQTFGIGESTLQQIILNKLPDWPDEIEIGFRAGMPLLEIKFTVMQQSLLGLLKLWSEKLRDIIADSIISESEQNLAASTVNALLAKQQKITVAESCTGGLIASELTQIAGASGCFEAGFVSYSNDIKQSMLGVSNETLLKYGAVSEAVVTEMALGALQHSGADYAIAVSGIAGPTGGSPEKPVGTVWIAWGTTQKLQTIELRFEGTRLWFQQMVAATALDLIRRQILGIDHEPRYIARRKVN